jgi:aspartate/methionine/tyrosine aminotransferase
MRRQRGGDPAIGSGGLKMMLERAKRLVTPSTRSAVPPFMVMDVMAAAARIEAAGGHVVHMEVGQPAASAPASAIAAAQAALVGGRLDYTEALGLPSLRARIARHYAERHAIEIDPARVAVTTGSSAAFVMAFLALFEPGDRVAVAAPGYPPYRHILTALGCEPVLLETSAAARWAITPDMLIAAHRRTPLKGVLVASPANPTGTMLPAEELAAIARYCAARGIRLVSDEIYHGLTYGRSPTTAIAVGEDAIVVNSFSKYFSMTGWRLGWMVLPPDLVRPVECLAQNLYISPPTLSQLAAVAVFDCHEELERNVARYAANRALLLEELPKAGFDRFAPADGAFYLYADVPHLTNDSAALCRRILAETGIAATPGIDFDPARGRATLRFSFAGSTATMAEAARRLQAWRR